MKDAVGPEEGYPDWREWPPLRAWEQGMLRQGWALDSVRPRDLLPRRDGSMLFAMLQLQGRDPDGKALLPYVLIRGAASVVVPVARNLKTGEERFVMIRQQRIGSGHNSLEFPAGMADGDEDPRTVAARELEEETGLRLDASELVQLWDKPLYSSPGLSDESILFYAARFELEDAAWHALEGGAAGHAHEGEHITTTLQTFESASAENTSILPLLGFFLHRLRFGELA